MKKKSYLARIKSRKNQDLGLWAGTGSLGSSGSFVVSGDEGDISNKKPGLEKKQSGNLKKVRKYFMGLI